MNDNITEIGVGNEPNLYSHPLAKAFLNKVYAWMAASMFLTAAVAVYTTRNADLMLWTVDHMCLLCIGTLVLVLIMCFARGILTAGALGVALMLFCALEGMLFGPILTMFTQESLGLTFACTAGTFGVMSLYGVCTKRDLSPWGRTLCMILFGLIICMVVNYFWGNGTFDLIASGVGVVVFSLLTAYDTQKILREGLATEGEERAKGAIMGALALYLDFINLFLYLLRFLGERTND